MTTSTKPGEAKRYRQYVQDEVDGVLYYETLAEIEDDAQLAGVYREMAEMEQRHLAVWQQELARLGSDARLPQPTKRARALMWAARRFGAETVLPVLKAMEVGADAVYAQEPVAVEAQLPRDERTHARIVATVTARSGLAGASIGRLEARHRALGGGNALRAAVLGANDGLTSNLALVMGVAGATPGHSTVILAGVAGLLAGAFSMALGEWISVRSAREAAEAQIEVEREELRLMPDSEREELSLIFRARGIPPEQAETLASHLMEDEEAAVATLAREELGIVPEDLGSPWTAAVASFVLFAGGALLPVLPFFFVSGLLGVVLSCLLAGAGLWFVGASITLLTGKSAFVGGMRQLVLGLAVAGITYGIGALVGGVTGI